MNCHMHATRGSVKKKEYGVTVTHVGDDPMEPAACIPEAVLTRRELAKVLRRARHHVIEQAKHDSACRFRVDGDVELCTRTYGGGAVMGVDVVWSCTDTDTVTENNQDTKGTGCSSAFGMPRGKEKNVTHKHVRPEPRRSLHARIHARGQGGKRENNLRVSKTRNGERRSRNVR